jgi:hypothetical protein
MQSKWLSFKDYNVEEDEAAEQQVRSLYNGQLKFPTLKYGEEFLKNPTISELEAFLEDKGLL